MRPGPCLVRPGDSLKQPPTAPPTVNSGPNLSARSTIVVSWQATSCGSSSRRPDCQRAGLKLRNPAPVAHASASIALPFHLHALPEQSQSNSTPRVRTVNSFETLAVRSQPVDVGHMGEFLVLTTQNPALYQSIFPGRGQFLPAIWGKSFCTGRIYNPFPNYYTEKSVDTNEEGTFEPDISSHCIHKSHFILEPWNHPAGRSKEWRICR